MPNAASPGLADWERPDDCFDRAVSIAPAQALNAALECGGPDAAGDANETGVRRATAAFHAAAAYNVLASQPMPNAACATSGECHQRAASLIAQSHAHQDDGQVAMGLPASRARSDAYFVQRRDVEEAIAMRGLAETGYPGAPCGAPSACLTLAAAALEDVDLTTLLKSEADWEVALACKVLDLRADLYSRTGGALDPRALEDLRRLADECPAQQAEASAKLAEIAFDRAERERTLVLSARPGSAGAANIVQSGFDAVSNYRQAISAGAFELPSYRAIGSIYLALVELDPANARNHLGQAVGAFQSAVSLSSLGDQPAQAAADLERLGESLIKRAELDAETTQSDRSDYEMAARAFADSIALDASPPRHDQLARAEMALGNLAAARAAFESAIPGLGGETRLEAQRSLASVLEQLGDPAGALQVLEAAAAQGPFNAAVSYEIGLSRFAARDFEGAQTALRPAIGSLTGQERAEASYMLSVAETVLRRDGWQDRALSHAEMSVHSGRSLWKYSRQSCLAAILKGGNEVKQGASLDHCLDAATPEAQLLRGMYALKRAQLMDVSAYNIDSQARWRGVLREAEFAFQRGRELLVTSTGHERRSQFDDLATPVDLANALSQAMTVIARCRREISIEAGSAAWDELVPFFGHYGVLRCSP